jgi:hypothetical protein
VGETQVSPLSYSPLAIVPWKKAKRAAVRVIVSIRRERLELRARHG